MKAELQEIIATLKSKGIVIVVEDGDGRKVSPAQQGWSGVRKMLSSLSAAASPLRCKLRIVAVCLLTKAAALAGTTTPLFDDPSITVGANEIRHSNSQAFVSFRIRSTLQYHGITPYGHCAVAGHGSHYAGVGLLYEIPVHGFWITFGTGPGLYRHRQNDPDLGYGLEFGSWLEVSRKVFGKRLGVSITHVSNAHLGSTNPGTEAVGLVLHF
jgi:hypothetical protein